MSFKSKGHTVLQSVLLPVGAAIVVTDTVKSGVRSKVNTRRALKAFNEAEEATKIIVGQEILARKETTNV